ncbi:hypothetical protein J2T60_000186 [Natronospira proteinivora]|uniref:Uncharacterized protein n=1 Tax=Natronospira proteinivora TaxID=1807133 RepID=A0ABT1G4K2_9GAMM|nr:hypothetical protein [Natronospira proteinivora]
MQAERMLTELLWERHSCRDRPSRLESLIPQQIGQRTGLHWLMANRLTS